MDDCLFCKIIGGQILTDFVYEDDKIVVFKDINPQAPVHLLLIPKEHIEFTDDINQENSYLIGHIFEIASRLAKESNLELGYRIVNNCKEHGGQSVNHIHFHLMGGRQMLWPAG